MGADAFVAFYGVKIELDPDDEDVLDRCGADTDPRCVTAIAAGLDTWSGRRTDGVDYFLLIGRRLGLLGHEHAGHVAIDARSLADVAADVGQALDALGHRAPAVHLQFCGQY